MGRGPTGNEECLGRREGPGFKVSGTSPGARLQDKHLGLVRWVSWHLHHSICHSFGRQVALVAQESDYYFEQLSHRDKYNNQFKETEENSRRGGDKSPLPEKPRNQREM